MKLLVKIGGTLIDSAESRDSLARQLVDAALDHRVVVVHGGGKQLSRYLEAQGIQSEFRKGFRVTPPEIIEAVLRIFAGSVNRHLVAGLQQAGGRAVGLTGIDAGLVFAKQLDPDLGAVGRVERVDTAILDLLTERGYIPAVACIAGGPNGAIFNVNADQMAVAVAEGFRADQLVFLTDVEGVLDENRHRIARLTSPEALDLIDRGVAQGGMEAKLRAATDGLSQGISRVHIVAGAHNGIVSRLLAGEDLGTMLVA